MCGNRYTLSQSRIQVTAMEKELTIVGYLADKPNWITNGKGCYREQDFVVSMGGVCKAIPATYGRHEFKVLVWKKVK